MAQHGADADFRFPGCFGQMLDMAQVVRVNEFAMPVEVCNSSDGNCHAKGELLR